MVKVKLSISYDGSNYNGFQIQNNARSIQEELNLALFKITKTEIEVVGAGRTDKGVHAFNQVITFSTNLNLSEQQWKNAFNANLPKDIYVNNVEFVNADFHPRFSCKEKEYMYLLNEGDYNPLRNKYEYQLCRKLDLEKMKDAAKVFVGFHSFQNFCSNSIEEVKDFNKTIYSFEIERENNLVKFTVCGSGFLRYQVRMMVGTLIEIGLNRKDKTYIEERLDKKEGATTSFNAPSCGLYLKNIKY